MNIKANKKNILVGIIVVIIIGIIGIVCYDRITVNNQYYIGEKNLEIPIFVYHNIVNDSSEIKYDYMQTTKNVFENQIQGLQAVGYHFITYEDLAKYKNGEEQLYKKSCIVTFDDGYEGVYENAYPIAKKYNIPLVITEHSSVERGVYVRKSYYKRIIDSYKTADKIITVGNGLKKEIEKLAGRNDIEVIGNLVDLSLFDIRNVKKENNDFTFFSVAFLEGEKGFDTLIKSFAKVYKNKNVKLVIGGDGSQKEWLKGIAKENGVEPQVLFTGALSREEVASWMNKCDVFVLPSRYETFGVVYIEALASGKPVIATFNGGAEDIINEEVGVLVEIDNVNKLAQAMEKVRENYNKYNPESLRNYCTEKFSANVIIKKIINVYKKVIR